MKKFHFIFIALVAIITITIIMVYSNYGENLAFSPDIFMTELLKFFFMTIIWTIIIDLYGNYNNEKKKKTLIDNLLLSYIIILQKKMENKLMHNELTQTINTILNNITTLKLILNFSSNELKLITSFEIKLCSPEFKNDINDIEFLIQSGLNYSNSNDSYNRIYNELKQFNNVFGHKN